MNIIDHGHIPDNSSDKDSEKFECDYCGCIFVCEKDEYYRDIAGAQLGDQIQLTFSLAGIISDLLVCSCPECHKICTKSVIGKQSYPQNLVSTSTCSPSSPTNIKINHNEDSIKDIIDKYKFI